MSVLNSLICFIFHRIQNQNFCGLLCFPNIPPFHLELKTNFNQDNKLVYGFFNLCYPLIYIGGFSFGRFYHNGAQKSHDLLKIKPYHWLKIQHSYWRANLIKDFFLQINFPPMRALQFITDHVIFKLRYNHINQMKTPLVSMYYLYRWVQNCHLFWIT